MTKKATIAFFIVTMFLFADVNVHAKERIPEDIQLCLDDIDYSDACDEFDSISEDMTKSGMEMEKPKEVSTAQYWLRKLGSPILLKYLALRMHMKNWWSWMTGKNKHEAMAE